MNNDISEHSLLKSIVLHLAPGILAGAAYFVLVPVVKANGYPSVMALYLAGLFVLFPFELGYLYYRKKKTGKALFKGIIKYLEPMPVWQYFLFAIIIIVLSGALFTAFNFTIELSMPVFSWIPEGMRPDMGLSEDFTKQKLLITYAVFLFSVVLIVPATEELYFRGFLLPRMPSSLKGWIPVTHSFLFAIYHTFTPWMIIVRTIGVLPLIYVVKKKKNIYVGIVAHCIMNSIDFIIGAAYIASL